MNLLSMKKNNKIFMNNYQRKVVKKQRWNVAIFQMYILPHIFFFCIYLKIIMSIGYCQILSDSVCSSWENEG